MKPVFQTRFGNEVMTPGNCFVACVASIMEIDLQGMPDEAIIAEKMKASYPPDAWDRLADRVKRNKTWEMLWHGLQVFLLEHYGVFMMDMTDSVFKVDGDRSKQYDLDRFPQLQAFHITSGLSPRGPFQHSCVAKGGIIIHDPASKEHPEGLRLLPQSESNPYEHTFFVSVNPAPEDIVLRDLRDYNPAIDYTRCSKHIPEGYE